MYCALPPFCNLPTYHGYEVWHNVFPSYNDCYVGHLCVLLLSFTPQPSDRECIIKRNKYWLALLWITIISFCLTFAVLSAYVANFPQQNIKLAQHITIQQPQTKPFILPILSHVTGSLLIPCLCCIFSVLFSKHVSPLIPLCMGFPIYIFS